MTAKEKFLSLFRTKINDKKVIKNKEEKISPEKEKEIIEKYKKSENFENDVYSKMNEIVEELDKKVDEEKTQEKNPQKNIEEKSSKFNEDNSDLIN